MKDISKVDPKHNIIIKGAKLHNLKNVDVVIPRNKFTVVTGLSGSGKSSLAYDTLYAEGQRRYVESLSSYARQFMGKLNKPKVDYIKGISPAIAVEQKINTSNPRSTVGTKTEIYDYLKLLFARIGKTYSPVSNNIVKKDSVSVVVDHVINLDANTKVLILSPIESSTPKKSKERIEILKKQGFARIFKSGKVINIDDINRKNYITAMSDIRADAGVGFIYTHRNWGPLEKPKPLIIRFDLPLFLNRPPYLEEYYQYSSYINYLK